MIKRFLLALTLFISPLFIFAQEEAQEEDPAKMVRETITVLVDKAKFAPVPVAHVEESGKKGKKKKKHVEHVEAAPDTGNSMIPAPSSEIVKRAQNWYKTKAPKYKKINGTNAGSNVNCAVTFVYKQKILNPENEVDGMITMDVVIEAKEGKYRYTVKNIKHQATKAGMSGGDIFLNVPECGSMKITDQTWKQIRSAARGNIAVVVDDLKAKMKEDGDKKKDDW